MAKKNYNSVYSEDYHSDRADILKICLMPFVMFALFGFPSQIGGIVRTYSGFAAPAFFILSGFFTLSPDNAARRAKLKRAVIRSLLFFLAVFTVYILINVEYLFLNGIDWVPQVLRKRVIFDFLVLDAWPFPVGSAIWFIQSLAFAYVALLIADFLKLLNKAFIYIPLFLLWEALMLFSGEFAAVAGFPYFGYAYIPAGLFTMALPYMLLGMILRKFANGILNIKRWIFLIIFVVGFFLAALELNLLQHFRLVRYTGHTVGFGVMALSVCCFTLSDVRPSAAFLALHGRSYAKRIYYLCQPVHFLALLLVANLSKDHLSTFNAYAGIIVFVICLLLAYLIGWVKFIIVMNAKKTFISAHLLRIRRRLGFVKRTETDYPDHFSLDPDEDPSDKKE